MYTCLSNPDLSNLKRIRRLQKISCKEMADKLGLETHSAYSKKEAGRLKISLQEAKIISNFLGESLEDIFFPKNVQK